MSSLYDKELAVSKKFAYIAIVTAFMYGLIYYYLGNIYAGHIITFSCFLFVLSNIFIKDPKKINHILALLSNLSVAFLPFVLGGLDSFGSIWICACPFAVHLLTGNIRYTFYSYLFSTSIIILTRVAEYQGYSLSGFDFSVGSNEIRNMNLIFASGLNTVLFLVGYLFYKKETFIRDSLLNKTNLLSHQNEKMKIIMSNIHQGLIIIDKDLNIQDGYSNFTEQILDDSNLEHQSILRKLIHNLEIPQNQKSLIESTLLAVGEPKLEFAINEHHLPKKATLRTIKNKKKDIELNWEPVIISGIVEKLIITFKDITEIEKLKIDQKNNEKDSRKIIEIVKFGIDEFYDKISSIGQYINNSRDVILQSNEHTLNHDIKEVFRNLHTAKGNAIFMQLGELANCIHHIEDKHQDLIKLSKGAQTWNQESLLSDLDCVTRVINSYLSIYKSHLGGNVETHKDKDDIFAKLAHCINHGLKDPENVSAHLKQAQNIILSTKFLSLNKVLSKIIESIPNDCHKLGKAIPSVDWGRTRIFIPKEKSSIVRDIFVHLIRNSLVHGIETPEERRSHGKPESGTLTFMAHYDKNRVKIIYSDDGAGLNLKKLSNKYRLNSEVSDQMIAELIFDSGVSTTQEVNELSGRGVGMNAVRDFLRKEGGDIKITFTGERTPLGFRKVSFELLFPYFVPLDLVE